MKKLREQVREFHEEAGVPNGSVPRVPSDERVRLRLRLIAEEFFELLDASSDFGERLGPIQDATMHYIDTCCFEASVNLVEVVDALADLDYVVEGTRLEFGVDGEPIADEVHRSNMSKFPTTVREGGKVMKGPHFSPPDIDGELKRQGWRPWWTL